MKLNTSVWILLIIVLSYSSLAAARQHDNLPKRNDSTMDNIVKDPRWLTNNEDYYEDDEDDDDEVDDDDDDVDDDDDDVDDDDEDNDKITASPSATPKGASAGATQTQNTSPDITSSPTVTPTIRKTSTPTSTPTVKHIPSPFRSPTNKNKAIKRNTTAPTSGPTTFDNTSKAQNEEYYADEQDDKFDIDKYGTVMEEIKSKLTPDEAYYLSNYEFKEEEEEAAKISFIYFMITMVLMVFTAHQLSEYPDGVYANMCRLTITVLSVFFKLVLFPFRKVCGFGSRTGYAHHLVTNQNDFRDPYANTGPNNRMEIL